MGKQNITINKKEFADMVALEGGTTKKAALQGVELFWDVLMGCLAEGKEVNFYGIGHFGLKTVKGKAARNPKTGEPCTVPEHKAVKFYPSRTLAEKICSGQVQQGRHIKGAIWAMNQQTATSAVTGKK